MSAETWERLSALPLTIESYELERLAAPQAYRFERVTTLVRLLGAGTDGIGEDVSPFEGEDDTLHVAGPVLPLAGEWTLGSLCDHLAELDQWPVPPRWDAGRRWRNWAFESAALDLALNQAGLPLHEAVGREPAPLRFVNSLGLGDPPTFDPIARRLERHPGLRFKLDVTAAWTAELMAEVAATGAVEIVDFKGQYGLDLPELPLLLAMYERAVAAFPDALLEDAHDLPEVTALLEPEAHRISYDAPIHSAADLDATPLRPRAVNIKPCRVGNLRLLLEVYDAVEERGLITYGGGMGELDVGRGQIQLLASLFHPDGPNDVAPGGYNADHPGGRPAGEPAAGRPGADGVPEEGLAQGLGGRAVLGRGALAAEEDGEADEIALAGVGRKRHASSFRVRRARPLWGDPLDLARPATLRGRGWAVPSPHAREAGRDGEPEYGDEAAGATGLRGRLGDHRVDQHHEQGAGRETVDGGLQVAARDVGEREAERGGERAADRDEDPQPPDRGRPRPGGVHRAGRPDRLGQVGDEDRRQQSYAHAVPGRQADPQHELLRDAVEERAEGERLAAAAIEGAVGHVVRQGAGGEPGRDGAGTADPAALLGQVEAHGADQRARAEGEHEPDGAVGPRAGEPEQRADDQRGGGERAPSECREHSSEILHGDGERA